MHYAVQCDFSFPVIVFLSLLFFSLSLPLPLPQRDVASLRLRGFISSPWINNSVVGYQLCQVAAAAYISPLSFEGEINDVRFNSIYLSVISCFTGKLGRRPSECVGGRCRARQFTFFKHFSSANRTGRRFFEIFLFGSGSSLISAYSFSPWSQEEEDKSV